MAAKKSPGKPSKSSGSKPVDKWAQDIDIKKGTLHRALGIKPENKVGSALINKIVNTPIGETITAPKGKVKITRELKSKANFARNIQKK
jgi:hypothetical protein